MASLVRHASMPATTAVCEEAESCSSSFTCFGRSLSRASSGMEYRALNEEVPVEERSTSSTRARLRWKAVAHEFMAARGNGGARRRKPAFSYDSKSYALNFDQGDG